MPGTYQDYNRMIEILKNNIAYFQKLVKEETPEKNLNDLQKLISPEEWRQFDNAELDKSFVFET